MHTLYCALICRLAIVQIDIGEAGTILRQSHHCLINDLFAIRQVDIGETTKVISGTDMILTANNIEEKANEKAKNIFFHTETLLNITSILSF